MFPLEVLFQKAVDVLLIYIESKPHCIFKKEETKTEPTLP